MGPPTHACMHGCLPDPRMAFTGHRSRSGHQIFSRGKGGWWRRTHYDGWKYSLDRLLEAWNPSFEEAGEARVCGWWCRRMRVQMWICAQYTACLGAWLLVGWLVGWMHRCVCRNPKHWTRMAQCAALCIYVSAGFQSTGRGWLGALHCRVTGNVGFAPVTLRTVTVTVT